MSVSTSVLALVRRASEFSDEKLDRLDARHADLLERDAARCKDLIPALVDPTLATLEARAVRQIEALPTIPNAGAILRGLPEVARNAALALLYWDALNEPLSAALYAPWAAIDSEDEPSSLWSEEADSIRADWISLPAAAFDRDRGTY